jgi:hypothetical protein
VYSILGIDKELFINISSSEKSKYKLVFTFFIIEVLCSFFSGCYISYMVSPNPYLSIIIGLFFGFIIFSVLKFSLSSIERNHALTNDSSKLLSFSFLLRITILLIFGFFIGFPLSCFIQRPLTQSLIDNQKNKMIESYVESQAMTKKNGLEIYNKRIALTQVEIDSLTKRKSFLEQQLNDVSNFDLELEYNILIKDLRKLKEKKRYQSSQILKIDSSMTELLKNDLKSFENSLITAELPLFQLTTISIRPIGVFVICLVSILLVLSLIFMTSLTYSSKYEYAKNASLVYRNKVFENHVQNIQECKTLVKEKFHYNHNFSSIFIDPPFNISISKQVKQEPKYNSLGNYFKGVPIEKNDEV